MADFIGAEKIQQSRYQADEVFEVAYYPFVKEVKAKVWILLLIVSSFLGSDVEDSETTCDATGIHMITTTGYTGP